jgi:hypothetical protein
MDTAGRELKEKVVSAGPIPEKAAKVVSAGPIPEKAAGEVERH